VDRYSGVRRLYALAGGGCLIADPNHLAAFQGAQVSHDIRAPIAVADNTKLKHRNLPYEDCWYVGKKGRGYFTQKKMASGRADAKENPKQLELTGAVSVQHRSWSLQQNLQIKQRRAIARVAQIESNHVVKSDPTAALDLPESSDSRLGFE
jgi:hypothetical protein